MSPQYAAGFIDGEGCITIHVNRSRAAAYANQSPRVVMQVVVSNNNLSVIQDFQTQFGGCVHSHNAKYNPNANINHLWTASEQQGAQVLRQVLPYLRIKKAQAELYLTLADLKANNPNPRRRLTADQIEERLAIARRCGELNRRGRPR